MASSPDIQELVVNRLKLEAFDILKAASKDKPGANGGHYAWFQGIIAHAEAENNSSRAAAAVIVMQAYGDALSSMSIDDQSLENAVHDGIIRMVQG